MTLKVKTIIGFNQDVDVQPDPKTFKSLANSQEASPVPSHLTCIFYLLAARKLGSEKHKTICKLCVYNL